MNKVLAILIEHNQEIGNHFYLSHVKAVNYLYYSKSVGWNLSFKTSPCITIKELEILLKDEHENL